MSTVLKCGDVIILTAQTPVDCNNSSENVSRSNDVLTNDCFINETKQQENNRGSNDKVKLQFSVIKEFDISILKSESGK